MNKLFRLLPLLALSLLSHQALAQTYGSAQGQITSPSQMSINGVFTSAGLPSAATYRGYTIYTSDVGPVYSNGTSWVSVSGIAQGGASVVQWQWGFPVGQPPGGFFANNGVYVIGQSPSSSATCLTDSVANGTTHITCSAATLLGTTADVGRVFTILDTTYKYVTLTTQNTTTEATGTISGGSLSGTAATISGVAITGTAGQFSCTCTGFVVGQGLTLSGTYGGTGSITGYVDPTTYYVSATNGTSTFTLQSAPGSAIVTTAGTPTGITYTPAGSATLANANIWLSGSPTTNTSAFSVPLQTVFSQAYMFFPANTISATTPAGVYYTICASTTVCTVYNNALASGRPVTIASPTPFAVTGAGAFTQSTVAASTLLTLAIPANSMGPQGSMTVTTQNVRNPNTDVVVPRFHYGGVAFGQISISGSSWLVATRTLRMAGTTSSEFDMPLTANAVTDQGSSASPPLYISVDETAAQNLTLTGQSSTASTNWLFILGGTVTTYYQP